ncbi:MAG: AAA family ATPase [Chitinophagaceae bacterium]|nr:AAA family ATPase [Chitinophagaceae bacterium]
MIQIQSVTVKNFKIFGEEISLRVEHDITVLIGANNSGKTSLIQAIALWKWALEIWLQKEGKKKKQKEGIRTGVSLNRLEISQCPVKNMRYFWHNTQVRKGVTPIESSITITFEYENTEYTKKETNIEIFFKYHSPDLMYCYVKDASSLDTLQQINTLSINILYAMSGVSEKEDYLLKESIQNYVGLGQTASVLRNICYHLFIDDPQSWEKLVDIMQSLFSVNINVPVKTGTGKIEISYNYTEKKKKTEYDLDITMAGRGQQQMLLILSYLLLYKNSVLLVDEPDAHLEILRQAQIFLILKNLVREYKSQLIIVTHSEVILNETSNINLITPGSITEITDKQEYKYIINALKDFGIEHYYKALINPRILYIESTTDKDMLFAFAKKKAHPCKNILEKDLHFYYTQNPNNEENLGQALERKGGLYENHKKHFNALKQVIPDIKGIAIFDSDGKEKQEERGSDLCVLYWKRYELENYFVTPKTIFAYIENYYKDIPVFKNENRKIMKEIVDAATLKIIFDTNTKAWNEYQVLTENLQDVFFQNNSTRKKMSDFAENIFTEFSTRTKHPMLKKKDFYKLIDFLEIIPDEVQEKLNIMQQYLQTDNT